MAMLLGLDIGTSATKAILIDESGAVRASADSPHTVQMPRPGWSEQDPDEWWTAACLATRSALSRASATGVDVRAVGFSGQMHGSVFLGGDPNPDDPRPLRPAMLWNDQRTGAQCRAIEQAAGGRAALIRITGNPALTGFALPKVLWLREHQPRHFEQFRHLLLPKDYVRFRLTGELAIDVGDASGVGLLDIRSRSWHADLMRAVGLDEAILPRVVESSARAGNVSRRAADLTGLREGTPVAAGSGDQMAGAVGMGVVSAGIVSATLGTSGVIFAHCGSSPPHDPEGRVQAMCAAVPGEYCVYGCMLSAAGALQWYRNAFAADESYSDLDKEAAAIEPGAEGLIFLPYLTGERCPHADPLARGALVGLTARHARGHVTRAVLEGVAFGMAQMLDLVRRLGIEPHEIRLSGGGAKSKLWREIQAACYGAPVTLLNSSEGSAYGAAILGGVAAGVWSSVPEACGACLSERGRIAPDAALVTQYDRQRRVFESLYPMMRGTFADLSRLDGRA
jgi:xylulokinase